MTERYDLEYVYVFGSDAKGLVDHESDVDLFVSAHKLRGTEIGGLFLALRNALEKEVDLVTYGGPRFISLI